MTLQEIDAIKWLIDALDHLQQYRIYSDSMAKEGKGCSISSPFTPKYLEGAIKTALQNTLTDEMLNDREQRILGV